ncbi:sporulation protein SpoOM [Brevibacillus laterosporus]|uniref:Stage 0 sporulation protein M n=1 Tax=Brevibacillus laterosporus LMG 15441 TaxID=1042163 RepID=A0A075RA76_BRELA|nr:sporulation protein [Brevibacillus laterosporus]AIG28168.1 stage 0 sporulation protein M [Brevibacillus laterosporus LMG 15441]RJL10164.1 sporulation protein SpoOM [Brevibacillus laterosporus]TPH18292.1 sporulation protein SpoOM [Brevibacillus laterosporus]
MSLFKKMMASVGIGAATVDTRLFKETLLPGELVTGEVHITGGDIQQDIDEIYIYVITHYERENNQNKTKEECILLKHRLTEPFSIEPQETKVYSFSFPLPYATPLTIGRQPVYLRTGLDIKNAIDPGDSDYIEVQPHPMMRNVLEALSTLGFQLYKVDCEWNRRLGQPYPFVQEFEFRPQGRFRKYVDELEVIFFLQENELEVLLEVDKRKRGFAGMLEEAFDMDERYVRLRLTEQDQNRPVRELTAWIEQMIMKSIG